MTTFQNFLFIFLKLPNKYQNIKAIDSNIMVIVIIVCKRLNTFVAFRMKRYVGK